MRNAFAATALTALFGLAAASPAAAQEEFLGLWGHYPDGTCDRSAPTDAVPIRITKEEIGFYESACKITGGDPAGWGNSYDLTLECSGEGETWETHVLIVLDFEDRLFLHWTDGGTFIGKRCG